ncbi:MAG: hypothetical protein AABZ61_13115, partial [Bacteroidota bacterium]
MTCITHSCVTRYTVFFTILIIAMTTTTNSQTMKSDYLRYIKQAAELGWKEYPEVVDKWKKNINPSVLWGYDAPAQPIYLADLLGFLYQETKDKSYAEKARDILVSYGDLRETYPKDYWKTRVEYRNGIPPLSNFFFLPAYSRSYQRIRDSGVLDEKSREKIEKDLTLSLDFIFFFPEWGAMNRTMLRAEGLYHGALALPQHPNADKWKQLAETLASDNLKQWEIEDATVYHPVWLYSLFSYADVSGRKEIFDSPIIKYYMDYYLKLFAPHGNVADFGDANWNSGWDRFVAVFEKAASVYRNPYYKYVANEMVKRAMERLRAEARFDAQARLAKERGETVQQTEDNRYNMLWAGTGFGSTLTDTYRWADDSIIPQKPTSLSQEVLEDIVGKKIVFRNGWEPTSTFMLLNYRDEGDGGLLHRDYLRNTLSVEEEKMHHGHSDENSICLLMSGGTVLLHDGGYRDALPSGQWGAYRTDYFHNRIVARKNKRDLKQDLFEFIRNSGAYRKVQTQKIDFLVLKDVDMSRTRLVDHELGYQWDRVITYVKQHDYFIVVDGIKALRSDYFTFTNLWHTRKIFAKGEQYYDAVIDTIGKEQLPENRSLLIYFPETSAKQIGTYPERRHYQDEVAVYQTISSHYNAGDMECFVTILLPHGKGESPERLMQEFGLMKVDKFPKAVGIEINDGVTKSALCIKFDLEMELARENIRPRYLYDLGKVKYGDFETDAYYLFATVSGKEVRYSAANLVKVLYKGQTLMEALPNTFGL